MAIPTIDAGRAPGKITSMLARLIKTAMHSSIEELIAPRFDEMNRKFEVLDKKIEDLRVELRGEIQAVRSELRGEIAELRQGQERIHLRIDEMGARLDGRIGALEARLDGRIGALEARIDGRIGGIDGRIGGLDGRINELSKQQQRMVEQIAALKTSVDSCLTLSHRVDRLEDRVFAKTG